MMRRREEVFGQLNQYLTELINEVDNSFEAFINFSNGVNTSFVNFDSRINKSLDTLKKSSLEPQLRSPLPRIRKTVTQLSGYMFRESFGFGIDILVHKQEEFRKNVSDQRAQLTPILQELGQYVSFMQKTAVDSVKTESRSLDFHSYLVDFKKNFRPKSEDCKAILMKIIDFTEVASQDIRTGCISIFGVLMNKIEIGLGPQSSPYKSINKLQQEINESLNSESVLKKHLMPLCTPNGQTDIVNYFALESDISRRQPARIRENCEAVDKRNRRVQLNPRESVVITKAGYSNVWEVEVNGQIMFVPAECVAV
ncbi:hypothetical protein GPJ56_003348 [Histomonas meleagridis]|uniref:uncharacterized protein n=1 Tax=Histomonas meleagridis TaxID=135588 RepID=UPI003559EB65|nr:hypothetical protein GPJ56_003348 [Histomonas meleagridis]KAH0804967.1 hypothetical protein GO595_001912 [Histomonas meleagridis]